jgi:Domain of unknown function (DU1801)
LRHPGAPEESRAPLVTPERMGRREDHSDPGRVVGNSLLPWDFLPFARETSGAETSAEGDAQGVILTVNLAQEGGCTVMKTTKRIASQADATGEQQLAGFIKKFDSKNAALIRSVRKVLRERLPTANELVYDNYNFFVIGYCSTERPSDCVLSIAAGANGVGLSFYYGATLPDPHKLLLGSGSQNRFIRIESAATLARPEVEELIAAAIAQAERPLPGSGRGKLVIRSISKKQKPRRKASD